MYIVVTALVASSAVLLFAYGATVVTVAHIFTTPKRVAAPPPPPGWRETLERLTLHARHDGVRLAAWYRRLPDARGAVIIVHGRDSCSSDTLRGHTFVLAQRLADHGLSVLLLDLRGHGESDAARLTFGAHEQHDILAAVDFLRANGHALATIGVLGASMGGASAIAAAAAEPALGALVTDSAFADLHALLQLRYQRLTRLPRWSLRGALLASRMLTGVSLTARPPQATIAALRGRPVLVIHAAGDPFVPVTHAETLAHASNGTLWITPGTYHLGSASALGDAYIERVTGFFATELRRASPQSERRASHATPLSFTDRRLRRAAVT
jgi:uncharacterized protein